MVVRPRWAEFFSTQPMPLGPLGREALGDDRIGPNPLLVPGLPIDQKHYPRWAIEERTRSHRFDDFNDERHWR